MTHPETLDSLADRIEALDGPDRAIDAEIESERRRRDAYAAGLTDKQRAHWEPDSGGYVSSQGVTYAAKHFTASLDAAMTLVGYPNGRPHNLCIASAYGSAYIVPNDGESYGITDPLKGEGRAKGEDETGRIARAVSAAAIRAKAVSA